MSKEEFAILRIHSSHELQQSRGSYDLIFTSDSNISLENNSNIFGHVD